MNFFQKNCFTNVPLLIYLKKKMQISETNEVSNSSDTYVIYIQNQEAPFSPSEAHLYRREI